MATLDFEMPERWGLGGAQNSPCGAVLASAATIAPTHKIHHVSGTEEVTTITLPWDGFRGPIILIPDAAFTTATGGNIAVAVTAVINRPLMFVFDGTLWYPHAVV